MEYNVDLLPTAQRDYRKLPPELRPRISQALRTLKNPHLVSAKKVRDSKDRWRIRVGDYRIIYKIDSSQRLVIVISIAHRREVYRR